MTKQERAEKRGKLWDQFQAIKTLAEGESRDLTPEEVTKSNSLLDEIDKLDKAQELENRATNLDKKLSEPSSLPVGYECDSVETTEPTGFESFGHFLQAVVRAASPRGNQIAGLPTGVIDRRLYNSIDHEFRAPTGLGETIPADGGFLVQTDEMSEIIKKVHDTGVLLSRVRKLPLSSGSNRLTINGIDETSRVAGSRMGGVRGYWAAEAAEKTASTPKFRQIELALKKLVGLCYATDELLEDAAALESIIKTAFAEEFAFIADEAIYRGTGAGQPLGVLNGGALISVAAEAGQAAATIVYENIVNMYSRLWARSRPNAVWNINQDCIPQLMTMSLAVGTGGAPVYLPANGAAGRPFDTLMGIPVLPIEQASTLGTVGDIALVDYSQYLWAEKGGMQQAQSIHVRFIYDESVFRFVWRVDGQPSWSQTLTPNQGTNTQSPYIVLATRS